MAEVAERIEGVVVGVLMGMDGAVPLVVFAGNLEAAAVPARTLSALGYEDIGAEVALLFEEGDPRRPLVVGRIVERACHLLLRTGLPLRLSDAAGLRTRRRRSAPCARIAAGRIPQRLCRLLHTVGDSLTFELFAHAGRGGLA